MSAPKAWAEKIADLISVALDQGADPQVTFVDANVDDFDVIESGRLRRSLSSFGDDPQAIADALRAIHRGPWYVRIVLGGSSSGEVLLARGKLPQDAGLSRASQITIGLSLAALASAATAALVFWPKKGKQR